MASSSPNEFSFRKSSSPYMNSLSDSTTNSGEGSVNPVKKWTVPTKSSFINGRGNVLPIGAATSISDSRGFSPPSSSSLSNLNYSTSYNYTSTSTNAESGEQTFRRAPAGTKSGTLGKELTSSTQSHINFPSAFGVTQRVIVRRTSGNLASPISSSARSSKGNNQVQKLETFLDEDSATVSDLDRSAATSSLSPRPSISSATSLSLSLPNSSATSPRSPIFPSKPTTPRSPIFPSKPTSLNARPLSDPPTLLDQVSDAPSLASPFVLTANPTRSSSKSTVPVIGIEDRTRVVEEIGKPVYNSKIASPNNSDLPNPSLTSTYSTSSVPPPSVLSRPRARTPDPFGEISKNSVPFTQSGSTESSTTLPVRFQAYSDRSESPTVSTGSSILDRPRPKTPDHFSPSHSFDSSNENIGYSSSKSSHALQKSTASYQSGDSRSDGGSVDLRQTNLSTSILDRPRPKTPDSANYLEQSSYKSIYPDSTRKVDSSDSGHQSIRSRTTTASSSNTSTSLLSMDLGIRESDAIFDLDSLLKIGRTDSPLKQEIKMNTELDRRVPPPLELTPVGNQVSTWRDSLNDDDGFGDGEEGDKTPSAMDFPPIEQFTPTRSSPNLPNDDFPLSPASSSSLAVSPMPSSYLSLSDSPSRSSPNRSPTQEFFPTSTSMNSFTSSPSFKLPSVVTILASEEIAEETGLDKSLPPTPAPSSPYLFVPNSPEISPVRRASTSVLPVIRRGFSKIMGNIPSPNATVTGFQVMSGRKGSGSLPGTPRPRESSVSSSKSGSGSSEQTKDSSSAGKRFADRFGRKGSIDENRSKYAGKDAKRPSIDLLPATIEDSNGTIPTSRRSFDLLKESHPKPESSNPTRQPTVDKLLNLATAQLINNRRPSEDTSIAPESPTLSSNDHSPEKPIQIATALRVSRPNAPFTSTTSALQVTDFPGRSTAVPKLVKRDSIGDEDSRGVVTSSPGWRKRVKAPDSGMGSEASVFSAAWIEVEDSAILYARGVENDSPERSTILGNLLLPFLRNEEENKSIEADNSLAKRQRQVLFGWLMTLTRELRELQPVHRGACLESLAGIAESRFMSIHALSLDRADEMKYHSAIVQILEFAVDKLNDKAVYANTLVFSGRVFALAFFRIEGVALKLLRALPPVKRQFVKRILAEAEVDEKNLPPVDLNQFPSHLAQLCLTNLRTYNELLMPTVRNVTIEDDQYLVREGEIEVEMSGNWLIRWTASDSDLPFAFYRAYHRQLAAYVVNPSLQLFVDDSHPPLSTSSVLCAPGFLFLAASLLDKCDALVHRNLRSVTSIGPGGGNSFNSNDSANLAVGQKPKVLELANRRLVSTMLDIVGGSPVSNDDSLEIAPDAAIRRHAFSRVLQVWIRASVKKTSMWDTRSVFILLDLIEGLIYTLSYPAPSQIGEEPVTVPQPIESCLDMFDIPFIFSFIKTILTQADNTVAIMRTIAFLYAHFEIFTLRSQDRHELCENIILDEKLFSRLYLHWNAGVRGYFIRLLVWRLARLGIVAGENQSEDKTTKPDIIALFELMNVRLEVIRRRHDELEPIDTLNDDFYQPKRSTICSTGGVTDAPYVVNELIGRLDEDDEEAYEEKEVVRTTTINSSRNGGPGLKQIVTIARVVSWIKVGLGKARNSGKNKVGVTNVRIDPFLVNHGEDDLTSTSNISTEWDYSPLALTNNEPVRKERPKSGAFFSFEFEGGLPPLPPLSTNDSPASTLSNSTSSKSIHSTSTADTVFPSSVQVKTIDGLPQRSQSGLTSRVSVRFSKRISILPPAALDILKENGEPVPSIPFQYQQLVSSGYDRNLHPYAIRGLRDYEDALTEWEDWILRLQEDEDEGKLLNRGFVDLVPRLSVSWPANIFED